VALVVLDREYASAWLHEQGVHGVPAGNLAAHPLVATEVRRAVAAANARLSRPEQVKKFHVVADEWLPGRELTPTAKMRRGEISRLYGDAIEELYA